MNWFNDTLLAEAAELIAAGDVSITEEPLVYEHLLFESFPFSLGRLAFWELPESHAHHRVCENPKNLPAALVVFPGPLPRSITLVDSTQVIFTGDSLKGLALTMQWGTLRRHAAMLFSCPQHYYVIPPDCNWCMSYTLEGDLYFALPATAKRGLDGSDNQPEED